MSTATCTQNATLREHFNISDQDIATLVRLAKADSYDGYWTRAAHFIMTMQSCPIHEVSGGVYVQFTQILDNVQGKH